MGESDDARLVEGLHQQALDLKRLIDEAQRVYREVDSHLKRLHQAGKPDRTGEPNFDRRRGPDVMRPLEDLRVGPSERRKRSRKDRRQRS
jgi:hypothetical protein